MTPHKRPRFGPAEILILMVIALIVLVLITHNFGSIDLLYEKLYSGTSVFIAVIMLVEFLLLKGSDRSPIYMRELDAARQRRRNDLLAMREMETQLVELRSRLAAALAATPGDVDAPAAELRLRIEDARQTLEAVLQHLRERI